MTANAINYANYLETARHNAVMERLENRKREIESEQAQINERKRRSDYALGKANLAETQRHNAEVESETHWNNMLIGYLRGLEREETKTHNRNIEQIQGEGNQIGWVNADINQQNVEVRKDELTERERSNRANEGLTIRGQDFGLSAAQTAASASRYGADMNYASSVYATDSNYELGVYRADKAAEVDTHRIDKQYESSIYNADMSLKTTLVKSRVDFLKSLVKNRNDRTVQEMRGSNTSANTVYKGIFDLVGNLIPWN